MPAPCTDPCPCESGKPQVPSYTSMTYAARIRVSDHQGQSLKTEVYKFVIQKDREVKKAFFNSLLFLYDEWCQEWDNHGFNTCVSLMVHTSFGQQKASHTITLPLSLCLPSQLSVEVGVENPGRSFHQMARHIYVSPMSLFKTTWYPLHSLPQIFISRNCLHSCKYQWLFQKVNVKFLSPRISHFQTKYAQEIFHCKNRTVVLNKQHCQLLACERHSPKTLLCEKFM